MPDYIFSPLETDEDQLQQEAFAYIQDRWPQWIPDDGNLEAWLIAACARMVASARDVGSDVPLAIFRYYGEKVIGVSPIDATSSVVSSTWTLSSNPAGRTIEAGFFVTIEDADGDGITFEVVEDVVIAPTVLTTTPGQVLLRSVDTGAETANIGGDGVEVFEVDSHSWVSHIYLTGVTSGGSDAEDDEVYLSRLATRMTLLTPRPIVPPDFELLGIDIAAQNGVLTRAMALDGVIPGRNQINRIAMTGTVTGGTWSISPSNESTNATLPWNATAAQVKAALEGLPNTNPGDVIVTGGPLPAQPIFIEYDRQFYQQAITTPVGGGSLTGTTPGVNTTVTQARVVDLFNQERAVALAMIQRETGDDVPSPIATAVADELESLREVNFLVPTVKPTRNSVDVTLVGVADEGADTTTVANNVKLAIEEFLSAARWGQPTGVEEPIWKRVTSIYHQDVGTVANNVIGFARWTTLTIGVNGQTQSASDKAIAGLAPVTVPGTITVTVTAP